MELFIGHIIWNGNDLLRLRATDGARTKLVFWIRDAAVGRTATPTKFPHWHGNNKQRWRHTWLPTDANWRNVCLRTQSMNEHTWLCDSEFEFQEKTRPTHGHWSNQNQGWRERRRIEDSSNIEIRPTNRQDGKKHKMRFKMQWRWRHFYLKISI